MVERIPKPPQEDILRSAKGETVDGYTHQLYFTYPKAGGIYEIIKSFTSKLNSKIRISTDDEVISVKKQGKFVVGTNRAQYEFDRLVSTIPLNLLAGYYYKKSEITDNAAKNLKYNSIVIAIVNVKNDMAGDNFAFMVADTRVRFHRLSKPDFLGESYHKEGSATYMLEITYRKADLTDLSDDESLNQSVIKGLQNIGFINSIEDVNFTDLKRFEYSYVIYDIDHRKNADILRNFFNEEGIYLNGRFGEFEYLNMDAVIRHSLDLAKVFV